MKARDLFGELADADEPTREARLNALEVEHADVVAKVRRLLEAHDSSSTFMESETVHDLFESVDDDVRRRIGGYRVGDVLGQGGMGIVYRAEQEHPRRVVALKVLPASRLSAEGLARFEVEAQALARLRHRAVTQVFEAGFDDGEGGPVHYIAMELVEGESLTRWAGAGRPRVEKLRLIADVADGLHHAHEQGVIHRDVKPSNILVQGDGLPKILDFGIARIGDHDETLTKAGQVVGTMAYMSPEQAAAGEGVDTRSDQYSLGVVAYELLTGHLPVEVEGCSLADAALRVRERVPQPLTAHDGTLGRDVDLVVGKALAKERGERYPSLAEFAADVRRLADGLPVSARPPTLLESLARVARRHRVASVLAVSSTTLLVAAAATLTIQNGRLREIETELGRSLREEESAREVADAREREVATANAQLEQRNVELTRALEQAERSRNVAEQARAEADAARTEAEHESRAAAAQNVIFDRWLEGGGGNGIPITAETTLLDAAKLLAETARRIPDDGLTAAFAYLTISDICERVGLRDESRENIERAVENTKRFGGTLLERVNKLVIHETYAARFLIHEDPRAAVRVLERALIWLDDIEDDVRDNWELRLRARLANWLAQQGRTEEALEHLGEFDDLFSDYESSSPFFEINARLMAARAYGILRKYDLAADRLRSIAAAAAGHREYRSQQQSALTHCANFLQLDGRLEEAEVVAREAVAACRGGASSSQEATSRLVLGNVLLTRESYAEAEAYLADAEAAFRKIGSPQLASALYCLARARLNLDQGDAASRAITEALALYDARDERSVDFTNALHLGAEILGESEPERALLLRSRLSSFFRSAKGVSSSSYRHSEFNRSVALASLGRTAEALSVAEALVASADEATGEQSISLERLRKHAAELRSALEGAEDD